MTSQIAQCNETKLALEGEIDMDKLDEAFKILVTAYARLWFINIPAFASLILLKIFSLIFGLDWKWINSWLIITGFVVVSYLIVLLVFVLIDIWIDNKKNTKKDKAE